MGKMSFKNMAIDQSTEINQKIKHKYNKIIKTINEEKSKP